MDTTSLKERSLKTLTRVKHVITLFFKSTINLFSKRDLVIIAFFTILGIGGVFAAGRVVLTQTDSQGAGYSAVTACDPNVTINKDITFDSTLSRYVISTISITDVNQSYISGCGNQIMELALPLNGGVTYASWTIPSSTFTNGVFTFGASNSSTGITYRAYTTLTPIDVEYSFASAAINTRASARAVTNGPVYDLLKDDGFTTAGQDASSSNITFALALSCGTLTVDTTQPGVSTALTALTAPLGYVKNNGTSIGVNGINSAAYLGYKGTVANINIVLPWISYVWKSDCTNPVPTFQGAIWDAQPAGVTSPIAWNFTENGHYYQYVNPTNVTWTAAYTAITGLTPSNTATAAELPSTTRSYSACSFKLFGLCGYFATVQTPGENTFLTQKVGMAGAWLGANDRTTRTSSKSFKWIDPVAPEYNKVFSTGTKCATQSSPSYAISTLYYSRVGCEGWQRPNAMSEIASPYSVNGKNYEFENWTNGEPNNYQPTGIMANSCGTGCGGEQVLQFVAGGTGLWNDYPENKDAQKLGYIVEFGDSTASGEARVGGGSKTGVISWRY